jgi:hypothetical protein
MSENEPVTNETLTHLPRSFQILAQWAEERGLIAPKKEKGNDEDGKF